MSENEVFAGYIFFILFTLVIWVRVMIHKIGGDPNEWSGAMELGIVMSCIWPALWTFGILYFLVTRVEKLLIKKEQP